MIQNAVMFGTHGGSVAEFGFFVVRKMQKL